MSEDVAREIRAVLGRAKFAHLLTPRRRAEFAGMLFADVDWFSPSIAVAECRDPKDDKYLELALAARASFLVSSDNDLLSSHPWRNTLILRPTEYLALF